MRSGTYDALVDGDPIAFDPELLPFDLIGRQRSDDVKDETSNVREGGGAEDGVTGSVGEGRLSTRLSVAGEAAIWARKNNPVSIYRSTDYYDDGGGGGWGLHFYKLGEPSSEEKGVRETDLFEELLVLDFGRYDQGGLFRITRGGDTEFARDEELDPGLFGGFDETGLDVMTRSTQGRNDDVDTFESGDEG